MWSFAAESAYLEHLDLADDVKKKMKDRGRVVMNTKTSEKKNEAAGPLKHPRNLLVQGVVKVLEASDKKRSYLLQD